MQHGECDDGDEVILYGTLEGISPSWGDRNMCETTCESEKIKRKVRHLRY